MIKIGILEDEAGPMRQIKDCLMRYQKEHPDFQYALECYDRALMLLEQYQPDFDLLFLDIQVPDMLGMEAAHRIREMDEHVMIVFVTNLTQYAIEGYSVNAFDYVLKPLVYGSFAAKMDRALRIISYNKPGKTLVLRTREGIQRITSDTVMYIEISNHDLLFHLGKETLRQWGSLSKLEKELEGEHFFRCNSCYLVNLKYVRTVRDGQVQVGQDWLTISKPRRHAFLNALAQYKGGSG